MPEFESFGVKQMKQRATFGMNILALFQDPGITGTLLCLELKVHTYTFAGFIFQEF